jgi:hypothetical protein
MVKENISRPKPMAPRAGMTKSKRRYANGGKTKTKKSK